MKHWEHEYLTTRTQKHKPQIPLGADIPCERLVATTNPLQRGSCPTHPLSHFSNSRVLPIHPFFFRGLPARISPPTHNSSGPALFSLSSPLLTSAELSLSPVSELRSPPVLFRFFNSFSIVSCFLLGVLHPLSWSGGDLQVCQTDFSPTVFVKCLLGDQVPLGWRRRSRAPVVGYFGYFSGKPTLFTHMKHDTTRSQHMKLGEHEHLTTSAQHLTPCKIE